MWHLTSIFWIFCCWHRTHLVNFYAFLYLNALHFTTRSESYYSQKGKYSLCSTSVFLCVCVMSTNRPQNSFTQPVQDERYNRYVNLCHRVSVNCSLRTDAAVCLKRVVIQWEWKLFFFFSTPFKDIITYYIITWISSYLLKVWRLSVRQ